MPTMNTTRNRLTAYALACGYIEQHELPNGKRVLLWREHSVYHVQGNGKWESSTSLAVARKAFDTMCKENTMQAYSNPKRASDPYALPYVEIFYRDGSELFDSGYVGRCDYCNTKDVPLADGYGSNQPLCMDCAKDLYGNGWYWWTCMPGCLPDSDAFGPFATRDEAFADAQSCADDMDDDEA